MASVAAERYNTHTHATRNPEGKEGGRNIRKKGEERRNRIWMGERNNFGGFIAVAKVGNNISNSTSMQEQQGKCSAFMELGRVWRLYLIVC
jgi:hypothetical protein